VDTDLLNDAPSTFVAQDLHEAIRRRAEEIYIENGRVPGRDVENWTQAEREIMERAAKQKQPSAIVLSVNGVQYVGEYLPASSDGYVPGEFGIGSSVTVRFEGDKMFVKRANGKELATRIVRKISGKPGVSGELI